MENKCDIEFIKSKFNDLKIQWNAVQDSHEKYISQYSIMQKIHLQSMIEDAEQQKIKYIKTIQENKNKILHEKDVERRTNQERVEEEQKETNIQILKLMRNIIGI